METAEAILGALALEPEPEPELELGALGPAIMPPLPPPPVGVCVGPLEGADDVESALEMTLSSPYCPLGPTMTAPALMSLRSLLTSPYSAILLSWKPEFWRFRAGVITVHVMLFCTSPWEAVISNVFVMKHSPVSLVSPVYGWDVFMVHSTGTPLNMSWTVLPLSNFWDTAIPATSAASQLFLWGPPTLKLDRGVAVPRERPTDVAWVAADL